MTEQDLRFMREWFDHYTRGFHSGSEEDRRNIDLKIEHTNNVCQNILDIAETALLDDNSIRLAETVGLFHDIGRFPQYARYKTFRDADSKNHGLIGVQTLLEENVLGALPGHEQDLVLNTVKFHNAYAIPPKLSPEKILYLKLIRDADKVDIFRVFLEYYDSPKEERASATAFGVPDSPEYSREMLSCLKNKRIASYSHIKTENDFRIMKLSWVFDLHFDESIRLLQKKDCINRIIQMLPQTEEIRSAVAILQDYIEERLKGA